MKKIEFVSFDEAKAYAKQFGGWLFRNEEENISIWYDAKHYTLTPIMKDTPCSGKIGPLSYFE